ncbi:MAG TPA: serine hydrolase domain-containing protein [Conexibacter sp.]|jgi:CubicO group peptidase (beta-lactamase class C family)|nr:serine hydrolase domain-containing protein [Conexibacter sp.]
MSVRADLGRAEVRGICAPRFAPVLEAFRRNFAELGELGGGVCVTHDGEVVVELVGGVADELTGRLWDERTLVMVWSATKGALATCVHLLAASGELDVDAPIARWWPEFAAAGKGAIPVAMALNHQAGVPGLSAPLAPDRVFDFDEMTARVAAQAPLWEPGTRHGYHSFTFGWILGELVRRATGLTPGRFLAEQVAAPLGLDLWIGLPEAEHGRVARVRSLPLAPGGDDPFGDAVARGAPIQTAVVNSWGRFADAGVCQLPDARTAEVPAANGFATARGLALLYRPLATDGRFGDVQLPARMRARMGSVESAAACDAVRLEPTRFASGFEKGTLGGLAHGLAMPEDAFGHAGQGGSYGLADPLRRLSIGFVTNAHIVQGQEQRAQGLVDAAYASLRT